MASTAGTKNEALQLARALCELARVTGCETTIEYLPGGHYQLVIAVDPAQRPEPLPGPLDEIPY